MTELDTAALLVQHRPVVQYDSLESYLADWAAVITDRPGNVLKRVDGSVLAAAGPPSGGIPVLDLAFLQPTTYPSGHPVAATDFIDETGSDYVSAAREMHARPGYANKVHAQAVQQGGVTWLQYWFFMYYDDPGFLGFGTHEGDIEMIQIRLDQQGQPDAVSYSQHRSGVSAGWAQVETDGDSPVVYSARGSHASMLRSGTATSDRSFVPDHNDGKGPRVKPDLIMLSQAQTPWAFWPGRWGGTEPEHQILGKVGIEANSPAALFSRTAWGDPARFHAQCDAIDLPPIGVEHAIAAAAPAAPVIQLQMVPERNMAHITYEMPPGEATPANLVIGVDTSQGKSPPATTVIPVTSATGELEAPLHANETNVVVRATAHSDEGGVSQTATATVKGG